MANFGGGKAFGAGMETATYGMAFAVHNALQNGAAVKRQIDHGARTYASVQRLAAAFKSERRKNAALSTQLQEERAKRKLAEYQLYRQQAGQ